MMRKNLVGMVLLLSILLGVTALGPAVSAAKESPYNLQTLLPADQVIAGWAKIGNGHDCAQDECLNETYLAVSQAYPYFKRGAVTALSQSYTHHQNQDGMEITVIQTRSFSHAKVIYGELGLPAYWKGNNSNIVTMGRDKQIQGRMGRCGRDCRFEFAMGAYFIRLKYYGRPERERAALMDFAAEMVKKMEK